MGKDLLIGCVGKPSSGKSTFFNAVAEKPTAKVGAFPFTTIDPNIGVTHFRVTCPCQKYGVQCKPRFGNCRNGARDVPIRLLDVAGLIPGASEGLGLGNKFLDDLRQADVLIHILDVTGTTNAKGEATAGYDPIGDHEWLSQEIQDWIFGNLWNRWPQVVRRHVATKSSVLQTLVSQLSGYGASEAFLDGLLSDLKTSVPLELPAWEKEDLQTTIAAFVLKRFKFVLALNKADLDNPDVDKNVARISARYPKTPSVLCSALTECFLQKMKTQGYIRYEGGGMEVFTAEDDPSAGLKTPDQKLEGRIERVRDLVLFRYGSTGVWDCIKKAVEACNLMPVFPIKNLRFKGGKKEGGAFPECVLVQRGTTVRQLARIVHFEIEKNFVSAENVDGLQLAAEEVVTPESCIIHFVTSKLESA